jgi:hypothetical protein
MIQRYSFMNDPRPQFPSVIHLQHRLVLELSVRLSFDQSVDVKLHSLQQLTLVA